MADLYQIFEGRFDGMDKNLDMMLSHFDRQDKKLVELTEKMVATSQRVAGLEQDVR